MGVWMEVKVCCVAKHSLICVCVEWRDCEGVEVVEGQRSGPDTARSSVDVSMNLFKSPPYERVGRRGQLNS